jgi:hypothetical protein
MPDSAPTRLDVRKQFGTLEFSLVPAGDPPAWRAGGSGRQALIAALRAALAAVDFDGGQEVVFRGLAYARREHLIATISFTRNL